MKQSQPSLQRQPYVNAPARESGQTASIFKTRSFQFLVDTVGAENIALGLGSNMARVAELTKGERFTPETAFHMETTLGLPHGFFDEPNPALAAETIARLKSPLDFIQTDDEPEAVSETPVPPSVPGGGEQPFFENSFSEEAQMPKRATVGSPKAVRNRRTQMAKPPTPPTQQEGSRSKQRASPGTTQQQALALGESAGVEDIRRANLHVLTARNGSKARLGVVMAMSGSNVAHRLYGKKRLDSAEASRFTERLGLPVGWLDTARLEADIPESVSRLLMPASRGRTSVEQHEPLAAATNAGVRGKPADARAHTGRARTAARTGPESAPLTSADVAAERQPVATKYQEHESGVHDVPAGLSPEERDGEAPAATRETSGSLPAAAVTPQSSVSLPATVTSLDNLNGIAPVAEALIKTLAGKARTGRLDELKALELLQQAVLL
ncbi:MAG TPA: hypothetical protein VGN12_17680 [Pirellulales bacterium]